MAEISPEVEERIVEQLTAIGWIRDLDGVSLPIVGRLCNCTAEEAAAILQKLVELRIIERVSESGGRPHDGVSMDSYRWAWVKGPGSS